MKTVKNRKRILLIFPPYTIPLSIPKRVQPPLGIAYLGAYLEKQGYEVELCDSLIEGFDNSKMVSSDCMIYGLSNEDIRKRISNFNPDIVGVSCLFTVQATSAYQVCDIVKDVNPNILTVMGGAHACTMIDEVMEQKSVDFIIPGEAEKTFHELIKAIESGSDLQKINGLVFRDTAGKVCRTAPGDFIENLDELPFPARHLLPMQEYFERDKPHGTATRHKKSTPIVTSRGCPANCVFCSIHTIWGKKFRGRSGQNVLDEIKFLVERYGIKEIQVEDDNLTFDKKRAHELLDKIIEADLNLSFTTPNGIAIWALDRPLLEKLKKAGFYRLTLAVESGNEEVLHKIIRKPLKLNKVLEVVNICNDLKFEIDTFFVVGFPGETKEQIQDTFSFANKLKVDSVKFFIATPYPGTDLYRIAKEKGYLNPGFDFYNATVFTKGQISTPDFTSDELEKMIASASIKTQINLFRRKPLTYIKSFWNDYLRKDPGAIFLYLKKLITDTFKKV